MHQEPPSPDNLLHGYPKFMKMGAFLGLRLKSAIGKIITRGRLNRAQLVFVVGWLVTYGGC